MNSTKWKNLFIGKGQMFIDAVAFRQALYKYIIGHKFSYKFKKNNMKKVIAKFKVEGCPWNIAAYSIGKHSDFLKVTRFNNEYIHNAQEKLIVSYWARVYLTSSIIVDALKSTVNKSTNEIRRDLYGEYDVRLTYSQAYRGRGKALQDIHGLPQDSYMIIPWIYDRLRETDATTVVKWEASNNNRFESPYKGTLLATSAYDMDNDLFLLAYTIMSGETFEDWSWFLRNVKDIIRSVEITSVYDRHNARGLCKLFLVARDMHIAILI
ncbi:uncharacterized protein LOC129289922 [Prosopis cineraria]|uniref:uncharacterized protein LOC129289922 n=1 Tax=Prosopis cineraria TaxID=364024 RepID=UPI00240ED64B|nr:uncharacterized protein LOC129289922 [Prosopis cineraria]